jgi:chemotaxis protein methyltransferase CheR
MLPDAAAVEIGPSDPASEALKELVAAATGNFRLSGKNSPVLDKVRHRLARNGLSSLGEYLALLKRGEAGKRELDDLIAELTVGETFFFRHPDHFDALRDHVLAEVLKRNAASRQLRIWSAGCSNGAETYSIAILVQSVLGNRLKDWNVSIVGSDINRAFLAEAEAAIYSAWTLRGVPQDQTSAYFRKSGQQWILREQYKQNVHFVYHNIINEEMPSLHKNIFAFDIVFCRNVMIYFDSAVNRGLAERIRNVMVDDGWLFVGSTDFNPHLDANFVAAKQGAAILYRKQAPAQRAAARVEVEALSPPAAPATVPSCRSVSPPRQPPGLSPRRAAGAVLIRSDHAAGAAPAPARRRMQHSGIVDRQEVGLAERRRGVLPLAGSRPVQRAGALLLRAGPAIDGRSRRGGEGAEARHLSRPRLRARPLPTRSGAQGCPRWRWLRARAAQHARRSRRDCRRAADQPVRADHGARLA